MKIHAYFKNQATIDYTTGQVIIPMALPCGMPREDIQALLDSVKDKLCDVEIKEHDELRELPANRMLWACLRDIQKARCEKDKDHITTQELYTEMITNFGVYRHMYIEPDALEGLRALYRNVVVIDEEAEVWNPSLNRMDTVVEILAIVGSSHYTKKEFSRLLNGVVETMRTYGLVPPPSDEMKRALDMIEEQNGKHHTKG